MGIVRLALKVALFGSLAVLVGCMALAFAVGWRAPEIVLAVAAATFFLANGLSQLGAMARQSGSWLVSFLFCIPWFALAVATLAVSGVLPDEFRLWAGAVFLTWFALFAVVFLASLFASEREVRQANPAPRPGENGWTNQQLALVMMFFGAAAVLVVVQCVVFGPPPYSVLAYFIGPALLVGGYLFDPTAIPDLLRNGFKPPGPPPPGGDDPRK